MRNPRWYFYLIQAGENGSVKFGITQNMPARMESAQTGNPEILRKLCVVPCNNREQANRLERNFAGATRTYATLADNEWRLPLVLETEAANNPEGVPDQCIYGHRRSEPGFKLCSKCNAYAKRQNRAAKRMQGSGYATHVRERNRRYYVANDGRTRKQRERAQA